MDVQLALLLIVLISQTTPANSKDSKHTNKFVDIDYSECGRKPTTVTRGSRARRVIGGGEANAHDWPWMVMVTNDSKLYCGGSILSPTYILTAAHCVDNNHRDSLRFHVGRHKVNESGKYGGGMRAKRIRIPDGYRRGDITNPGDYDMALIQLSQPLKFNEHVRPICLATRDQFGVGDECVLTGWGYTSYGMNANTSNTLQEVRLPLVSYKVCNSNKSYGGNLTRRYLCAGFAEGGKDGCNYDSGSPLVCARGSKWYQVGVMVWGDGCAKKHKYGVYGDLTEIKDMIRYFVRDLPSSSVSPTDNPTLIKHDNKDKIFIAIVSALSVVIILLLTTLCIVSFYTRGYICCIATERHQSSYRRESADLDDDNGKLNGEVSI